MMLGDRGARAIKVESQAPATARAHAQGNHRPSLAPYGSFRCRGAIVQEPISSWLIYVSKSSGDLRRDDSLPSENELMRLYGSFGAVEA